MKSQNFTKNSFISLIIASYFFSTFLFSDELILEKDWNLVGFGEYVDLDKLKNQNSNISKFYFYKDQKWQTSGEITPTTGVWIKSNIAQNIPIDESQDYILSKETSSDESDRVDQIKLVQGWNLVALPINSTVSPKVFKNAKMLFKMKNSKWHLHRNKKYHFQENNISLPDLTIIGAGEGFWVLSEQNETIQIGDKESELSNFETTEEAIEYLKTVLRTNQNFRNSEYGYYPVSHNRIMPVDDVMILEDAEFSMDETGTTDVGTDTADDSSNSDNSENISDSTTTNTQEKDVDEADIVKHDGKHIFYLSSEYDENEILVTSFENILAGNNAPITSIQTKEKPNELYLIDNKLIAVHNYSTSYWSYWQDLDYGYWGDSKSYFEVYDVEDLTNIKKLGTYFLDGNLINTRVANGKLYIVSRYLPSIEVEYPKVYVDECNAYLDQNYYDSGDDTSEETVETKRSIKYYYDYYYTDEVDEKYCWNLYYDNEQEKYYYPDFKNPVETKYNLMPKLSVNKDDSNESNLTEIELFTGQSFYAPAKINQNPFVTTTSSFDISDFDKQEHISVVGNSSTVYASSNAIYFVSEDYPVYYSWRNYKQRTSIYKINIKENLKYSGQAFVDGEILSQFSLSEYNDILRIATTTGWSWRNNTDNIVTTLQEIKTEDNNSKLEILDQISGLGKEGETIHGVRFFKNRGYIVTFKQTDPLYVLDLSDPANIQKGLNPLEINGYSSYFHEVNDDLLLSIGVDASDDGGMIGYQIQLFNVSDFDNPELVDKYSIINSSGGSLYSSAIEGSQHKAFTYRDSDNLFGFPLRENIRVKVTPEERLGYTHTQLTSELMNKCKYEYFPAYRLNEIESVGIENYYALNHAVESCDIDSYEVQHKSEIIAEYSDYYYTEYYNYITLYKKSFNIYQVDEENSKIKTKVEIESSTDRNYGNSFYTRGIIFSTDAKNYGLYIEGANFFLKEIPSE
jgi:uncharacterized secreted protein with C-terminal beta-propeller domain